jgi:hypothetical protein
MVVNSIDPLAPYKASGDLVLELVSITAIIEDDPEGAAATPCRVEIVEPHSLIVHQPPGGYLLENRQMQMTCAKSVGVRLGSQNKVQGGPLTDSLRAKGADWLLETFPPTPA